MAFSPRSRATLAAVTAFATLAGCAGCIYETQPAQPINSPPQSAGVANAPAENNTSALQTSPGTSTPNASPIQAPPDEAEPAALSSVARLMMPVEGIRPEHLTDTFTQSRSEGREHNAIDIIAPSGTPVRAAADGRIVKLLNSERGGITLYQLGTDERTVYYYAHLDRYAEGIGEGRTVRRGETIAYVGDTGNAQPGNHHLHFQIFVITDPKNFWDGTPINPYPLLLAAEQ